MNSNNIPVFSIMGNHDIPPGCFLPKIDFYDLYREHIDDRCYKGNYKDQTEHDYWDYFFDYGDFRFIIVDNNFKKPSIDPNGNWAVNYKEIVTQI